MNPYYLATGNPYEINNKTTTQQPQVNPMLSSFSDVFSAHPTSATPGLYNQTSSTAYQPFPYMQHQYQQQPPPSFATFSQPMPMQSMPLMQQPPMQSMPLMQQQSMPPAPQSYNFAPYNNELDQDSDGENDLELPTSAGGQKSSLSRHVTSVITHFTSSPEGYSRLLSQLSDIILCINEDGTILDANDSILRHLELKPADVIGSSVSGLLHKDDADLLKLNMTTPEFLCYVRMIKGESYVLMEIKGTLSSPHRIISCRPYVTPSSTSINSILQTRIENIRLRRKLELLMLERGLDPNSHGLLNANMGGASSAKARKHRLDKDDLFCRQCGSTTSPEWRKGPEGPKTYALFCEVLI